MKFRKKPVVIEAVRWTGDTGPIDKFIGEGAAWSHGRILDTGLWERMGDALFIVTVEGEMRADVGDWIIRGVNGEFYPCKADIFAVTYEPV